MASPLKWVFELYDKISGPAKNAEKAIQSVDKAASLAGGNIDKLGKGADGWKLAGKIGLTTEGIHRMVDGVESALGKMKDLGTEFVKSAFDAATFEQSNKLALQTLLGSAEAADRVTAAQKRFALGTGLSLEVVAKQYRNLIQGGFKTEEIPVILRAAGDISAIRGEGAAGVAAYAQAFADIRSQGQLTGRSLAAFKGVVDFDTLAKSLGVVSGGWTALRKNLNENPISAAKGINALLDAIAKKDGGLGTLLEKQAHTIPGIVERISTGWKIMLGDLSEKPEFGAFQKALESVAEMFDPGTAAGKRMEKQVAAVLDKVLGLVAQFSDPSTIQNFFETAIAAGKGFVTILKQIGEGVQVVKAAYEIVTDPAGALKKVREKDPNKGFEGPDVFANGPQDNSGLLAAPTKQSPQGSELPPLPYIKHFAAGGPAVGGQLGVIGEGGRPEKVVRADQGGGMGSLSLVQHFDVKSQGHIDERELAEHLARISKSDLLSALEQFGQSQGAL